MNRLVTTFKQAGTRSFRLGSSKLFGEFGGNAQNPDKETLEIFIPSAPDRSFVQADQAGAEALVVAYISAAGNYRALFQNGIKPHTYLALHIFHEQYKDIWPFHAPRSDYLNAKIAELPKLSGWQELSVAIADSGKPYDIGKRTAHAKSYRMGPRTFQMSALKQSEGKLNLSFREAKVYLATFEVLFPEVIAWQAEIEAEVRSKRVLHNLFGFPRTFNRVINDGYIREAISFIPQSTVACITHRAIVKTQRYIEENNLDWHVLNNKHDSYLLETPDSEIKDAAKFMISSLGVTIRGRDCEFTMRSEVKAGKNWKDFSKDNPLGMTKVKL